MLKTKFKGKVIIVTGASSGIGRELSLQLGAVGATVVLAARRNQLLEEAAKEIQASGGKALVVQTDLCDATQIAHLVEITVKTFGRIDALINVAGVGWYDWMEEITSEELQQQYQTNIIGMVDLIRQVVPLMKNQHSGQIVNFSSYASRIAVPPLTIYASTKYAIEGVSDALRRELAPWGIQVMRVHPWAVATTFNDKASKHDGIVFPDPSFAPLLELTSVTTTDVAKIVIQALEHPKNAIYISKWRFVIDFIALVHRFFPGVVDFAMKPYILRMWKNSKHDLQAHAAGVTNIDDPK